MSDYKTRAKERDGYKCRKCGHDPSNRSKSLHAHHITPSVYGGADTVENIATLCSTCHDAAPTYVPLTDFHSVYEIYESTGRTPAVDLVQFGAEIDDDVGFGDAYDSFISVMDQYVTPPRKIESVWLLTAVAIDFRGVCDVFGLRDDVPVEITQ